LAASVLYLVLLAACAALQHTWPGWLLLWGRAPDLALAGTVCIALTGGPMLGCYAGLCSGLLAGSTESALLGGYFVAYMGVGTAVGLVRGRLFADRVLVAAVIVLCAVPVVELIRLVFAPPPSPGPWLVQTLVGAPYSAVAAAPIYLVVRAMKARLPGSGEP
jgi:hypothetical protein